MIAITNDSLTFPTKAVVQIEPCIVKQAALRALAELALSLGLMTLCAPFIATTAAVDTLMGATIGFAALNFAIEVVAKKFFAKDSETLELSLRGAIFSSTTGFHTSILIHEAGHAFAAKLLFKGTPTIQVIPFNGGLTSYSTKTLSTLGQNLGFRNSILLITLAGPALALLAASVALATGVSITRSRPETSEYLSAPAVHCFLSHAQYACSTLWAPANQIHHDFVRLRTLGLHPLAATAAILTIPILISKAFRPKE